MFKLFWDKRLAGGYRVRLEGYDLEIELEIAFFVDSGLI
jgi:hypothetical protein